MNDVFTATEGPTAMMPGGLAVMCPREAFLVAGVNPSDVHSSPASLSALSVAISRLTGMGNLGLPFTMTIESEAYGGEREAVLDSPAPIGYEYPLKDISDFTRLGSPLLCEGSRLHVALEAISLLGKRGSGLPVMGDLVGPLGLATSLVDEAVLLKATLKRPSLVHDFLGFLVRNSIDYLKALKANGADAFFVVEPALRPELFGPAWFEEFSLPYINRLVHAAHALGAKAIVHLCGDVRLLGPALAGLEADCLGVDSCVSMEDALRAFGGRPVAGNIPVEALEKGPPDKVAGLARDAVSQGASIVMPSCGLTERVRVENLRAMAHCL